MKVAIMSLLIMKWPGLTEPGTENPALISQIDLMATFAALLDYQLPEDVAEDSHNLLPLLNGRNRVSQGDAHS